MTSNQKSQEMPGKFYMNSPALSKKKKLTPSRSSRALSAPLDIFFLVQSDSKIRGRTVNEIYINTSKQKGTPHLERYPILWISRIHQLKNISLQVWKKARGWLRRVGMISVECACCQRWFIQCIFFFSFILECAFMHEEPCSMWRWNSDLYTWLF